MNKNQPTVPEDVVAKFRERVMATRSNRTHDSLMEAVGPVVEMLKSRGRPSDEVFAALQQLSRDFGLSTSKYVFGINQGSTYQIIDGVIGACIERAYSLSGRRGD